MILKSLLFALVSAQAWGAPSADEIMKKNELARQIQEIKADARLTQKSSSKDSKVKEFTWWRKLASNRVDYKTLVRFHAPATIKGEGILMLEHEGKDNEVLLYLPAYKKVRRVENQQQTGKFMGSNFSYSDMATPHVSDYQYKLLKEETCPLAEHRSVKCYVIESKPARDSVKERTGYSRIVQWVRSDQFMTVQAEYYGLDSQLMKKFEAYQMKKVDEKNGKWMSLKSNMTLVKSGDQTILEFEEVEVDSGLAERIFTTENLSRPE